MMPFGLAGAQVPNLAVAAVAKSEAAGRWTSS